MDNVVPVQLSLIQLWSRPVYVLSKTMVTERRERRGIIVRTAASVWMSQIGPNGKCTIVSTVSIPAASRKKHLLFSPALPTHCFLNYTSQSLLVPQQQSVSCGNCWENFGHFTYCLVRHPMVKTSIRIAYVLDTSSGVSDSPIRSHHNHWKYGLKLALRIQYWEVMGNLVVLLRRDTTKEVYLQMYILPAVTSHPIYKVNLGISVSCKKCDIPSKFG